MTDAIELRPFDPARDWAAAAELISAAHLHDGVDWLPTPEVLQHEWGPTQPMFDPARDVRVAEAAGRLSGLVSTDWRERDGRIVSHRVEIWVRPELRRSGLGSALLAWAEGHARQLVAAEAGGRLDRPHVLDGWADTWVPGAAAFAEHHGYRSHRHGYEMLRSLAEPIDDHPLPPGLAVRPVDPGQHRAIWDADVEAFLDHPEPATRTDADFERWFSTPYLDTSLYQVAWAGDEVAGSVLTSINAEENERLGVRRGWLDHVSVRRAYRGRGLAASLIASSLRILRDRGLDQAALGVDAENPTGALRLYEKLGFRRYREGVGYRKNLDR